MKSELPPLGKGFVEPESVDFTRCMEYIEKNCCRRQQGKASLIDYKFLFPIEGTLSLENFQGYRKFYKTESRTMPLCTTAPCNCFSVLLYSLFYKFQTMRLLTLPFFKTILMPTKSQQNSPSLLIILLVLAMSSYILAIKINKLLTMAKPTRDVFLYAVHPKPGQCLKELHCVIQDKDPFYGLHTAGKKLFITLKNNIRERMN